MSEGTDPAAAGLHVRGDVIKMTEWGCSAAQRPGKSHHISPQTKRSSGIHFHSSDSLSCTNLIFVCQLQAKWSPRPSAHSGIAIQQPSTHTNYSTLLRPLSDLPTAHSPLRKHNRVVEKHGPGTGLDKSYRGTDWDWACEERKWRAGGDWCCTVIFIGRRYEMLFWAIKEKPQGCWCGDEGTENASRKTRCPGERGCEDVVLLKTRW